MANALTQKTKLLAAMAAVNKAIGPGTMARASEVAFSHLKRLSTGIFNLDMDTGGGIPKGRITMMVGDESTGKSTICMLIAANAQHTCRQCMETFKWYTDYQVDPASGAVLKDEFVLVEACPCGANDPHSVALLDAEGSFDPAWATALGVDAPALILGAPESAEESVDSMNALIRSGELDLLIIDSIAMLTPRKEIEDSANQAGVGLQAKIINRAMRTLQSGLNSLGMNHPNKPAILQVNQFREKVGVMYGDPRTWPGGKGQNFAASILIITRAGKVIDGKGNPGGKDEDKVGIELHYTVEKNKTFTPKKKGSYKLFNADAPALGVTKGHIDNFEQMVEYGEVLGVISKNGAWYDLQPTFGPEFANPDSKKGNFQGLDALLVYLAQDEKKTKVVRERLLSELKSRSIGAHATAETEPEPEILVIPD